ncbi:MAG: hypothetical protein AAGG69_09515 [Pseudomonadota bacterium]
MTAKQNLMKLSSAVASVGLLSTGANADDDFSNENFETRWSGFYGGINFGIGDMETGGVFDSVDTVFDNSALSTVGAVGGGQAGWALDVGDWVVGIEGDITGLSLGQSATDKNGKLHTLDTDYLASLQARVGKPLGDSFVFGSAGVAYLSADVAYDVNSENSIVDVSGFGFITGVGIATRIAPNISLGIQGNWAHFGSSNNLQGVVLDAPGTPGDSIDIENIFTTKITLNYHFGGGLANSSNIDAANYSWSGFHVGASAGYGGVSGSGVFTSDANLSPTYADSLTDPGAQGSVHLGYSQTVGDWLIGVEGDIGLVDWNATSEDYDGIQTSFDPNYIATLRGRAGRVMGNTLIYGTAGVAYLDASVNTNKTTTDETFDYDAFGGVFGAGIETFLSSNVALRSEALYYTFGKSVDLSTAANAEPGSSFSIDDGFKFSIGLSYHM